MKNTMIALALTAMSTAAPIQILKPLELSNLNAGVYSTSMPTTTLFSFTLKDPNTHTHTTCSGVWSAGQAGSKSYLCSNDTYQLQLFNGIYNIENFDLGVAHSDGSVLGRSTVKGHSWKCDKQESPLAQCKWDGVLKLHVAA